MTPIPTTTSVSAIRSRAGARRSLVGLCLVFGLATLSACGAEGQAAPTDPPTTEAPTTSTTAAATTTAPATTTTTTLPPTTTTTTTSTTTSTSTTTTTTTTTTLFEPPPTQPVAPIAPPPDARSTEPEISLGSIEIPKLGVHQQLLQGIRLSTLDKAPGHWPGTALPGQVGNAVIAGHRTTHNQVFRDVDQLVAGDEIRVHTFDGTHVYHVNRVEIVNPDALWIIDPTETATVTLFACHPPGSTRQRIVVFADLVSA